MICDRVGILYKGELKSIGPISDLLSKGITEWEIVLGNVGDDFRSCWEPKVAQCTSVENDLWITSNEEGQANQIISQAVRDGGTLISLTPRRESLEDYFIREVGQGGGS